MVRLSTVGGAMGVVTGLWTLSASFLDGVATTCPSNGCPGSGFSVLGVVIMVLAIALVFNSAVSFFWHRRVLYVSGLLSALVAVSVLLNASSIDASVFWVTVVLSAATAIVNLMAARAKTGVSEQSNPMNLPVFG